MAERADDKNIEAFYARGLERDRLAGGDGELEFLRTQRLLDRYLPPPPATVIDVGGGPGRYSVWLAARGYRVHLIDPVPLHIEQARAALAAHSGARADVGDARALDLPGESADAVLLLGPLYHLQDRADRVRALTEARRVCKPDGVIAAATISRFASTIDGLQRGLLVDPVFREIVDGDMRDGRHMNPTNHPAYFTTAYFHRVEDIASEVAEAGLALEGTFGIEGLGWLLADLAGWLSNDPRRSVLLNALERMEAEPSLLGVSAHLLTIAKRPRP